MQNEFFSCCFTGYRPEKMPFKIDKSDPGYIEFENRLINKIIELINAGCTTFISGMATGFDIIAAECVLEATELINHTSVSLICAIPFIEQSKYYSALWKEKYNRLLQKCDNAILISDKYYKGCFMKRNIFMVDNSDIVLTFYDGKPGGTKNTVNYAEGLGRKTINLNDENI